MSKKIFAFNEGPPFYKAQVLVTSGDVAYAEARTVIWKALKPGGFSGVISGWRCQAKGLYDPFTEKCERGIGAAREAIKSGKPKSCGPCSRTSKRLSFFARARSGSRGRTAASCTTRRIVM